MKKLMSGLAIGVSLFASNVYAEESNNCRLSYQIAEDTSAPGSVVSLEFVKRLKKRAINKNFRLHLAKPKTRLMSTA